MQNPAQNVPNPPTFTTLPYMGDTRSCHHWDMSSVYQSVQPHCAAEWDIPADLYDRAVYFLRGRVV